MKNVTEELTATITAAVRKVFPSLIAQELLKLGGKLPGSGSRVNRRDQVAKLRAQGKTPKEIATTLGMHLSNVYPLFRSRDSSTSVESGAAKGEYSAALAAHGTHKKAAASMGIARSTFSDRLAAEKAA